MKVKFRSGYEITYEVIDPEPIVMYSEVLNTCLPHIKIDVLGYVPAHLLVTVKNDFKPCLN